MSNLPAYLQTQPAKNLNEVALLGIGSALPPHISIRGNTFTLVDASGSEQNAGPMLDICVADISDVICKQYYAEKWSPDSAEPPLCWSANGLAPSREAMQPQSPLCAPCPHNQRGSAVSAISGAAIKACRDERWLGVLIPQMPAMRFQLRLTPGSFKNWRDYLEKCKGSGTNIADIVTRLTFEAKTNGVLLFQAVSYIDEATANARTIGYTEKAFDVLVGRNDVPIQGALPAPQTALSNAAPASALNAAPQMAIPAQPAAVGPQTATFAPPPAAAFAPPTGFPGTPSAQAEPVKRQRRTKAQIAADNAAQGQPSVTQLGAQPAAQTATQQPMAPFVPQTQPAAPVAPFRPAEAVNPAFGGAAPQQPSPGAQFGIQSGVAPNPELAATLKNLFPSQQ